MENKIKTRLCQICRLLKQSTIQLKCDHIICDVCLETQKLYTTDICILCCCIKWL